MSWGTSKRNFKFLKSELEADHKQAKKWGVRSKNAPPNAENRVEKKKEEERRENKMKVRKRKKKLKKK